MQPDYPDHETPQTVAAWAKETFGPCDFESAILRLQEEVIELCRAIRHDPKDHYNHRLMVTNEIADVAVCLYRVAAFKLYTPDISTKVRDDLDVGCRPWVVACEINRRVAEMLEHPDRGRFIMDRIFASIVYLAYRYCMDLQVGIDQKMKINRNRKWIVRGDGTGYHVKEVKEMENA